MKTRRTFLSMLGLSAAVGVSAAFAAPPATSSSQPEAKAKTAVVGEKAPNFTLEDTTGTSHDLSDFEGKIVVLQWINYKCPVCVRVSEKTDVVKNMRTKLVEIDPDIVHIAINSSYFADAETTAGYLKNCELEIPALMDTDGKVGHLYGAKTTPQMFVIDAEGVLRYSGAINDDQRGSKGDDAMNYVVNAVSQIKSGSTVTPDKTKPYGCSVKYAKK
jgi:peroxiredoxin